MKNNLEYKINTSNLIIITKDSKEYSKDIFDDLEIEIIKKNWLTIYPFWFINNNNKYIIRGKCIRRKDTQKSKNFHKKIRKRINRNKIIWKFS